MLKLCHKKYCINNKVHPVNILGKGVDHLDSDGKIGDESIK